MRSHCPLDTEFENRGCLRSNTLPLGHKGLPQYSFFTSETLFSLKLEGQSGARTRDLRLSKQAVLITASRPPPFNDIEPNLVQCIVNSVSPNRSIRFLER